MSKSKNIRLASGLLAVGLATTMVTTGLTDAYAEGLPVTYTPGSFIVAEIPESTEDETFEVHNQYVVQAGDTLAGISRKICKFFEIEEKEYYWVVLAFLNGVSPIIHEGDVLEFPTSVERMDEIRDELNSSKWTARYIAQYDVYGESNRNGRQNGGARQFTFVPGKTTVRELALNEYGRADDYFVELFIKSHGLSSVLTPDSVVVNNDIYFLLGEDYHTGEEISEFEDMDEPTINWDLLADEGEITQETLDYINEQTNGRGK